MLLKCPRCGATVCSGQSFNDYVSIDTYGHAEGTSFIDCHKCQTTLIFTWGGEVALQDVKTYKEVYKK